MKNEEGEYYSIASQHGKSPDRKIATAFKDHTEATKWLNSNALYLESLTSLGFKVVEEDSGKKFKLNDTQKMRLRYLAEFLDEAEKIPKNNKLAKDEEFRKQVAEFQAEYDQLMALLD